MNFPDYSVRFGRRQLLSSTHFLARPMDRLIKLALMAFVQAVGEDRTLLTDGQNRPIYVPALSASDGKGHGEVSGDNEVPAWDKMTVEQKVRYQEYLAEAQRKYFQSLKVTRGRVADKGDIPVILHPGALEAIKAQRIPDVNALHDMVNSSVHQALIKQSGVLTNSISNLIKDTADGKIFTEGYRGPAYHLPIGSPDQSSGTSPQIVPPMSVVPPVYGMPTNLWSGKADDSETAASIEQQKIEAGGSKEPVVESNNAGKTPPPGTEAMIVHSPDPTAQGVPPPIYYLAKDMGRAAFEQSPHPVQIPSGYHVVADFSGRYNAPHATHPPQVDTVPPIVHPAPMGGTPGGTGFARPLQSAAGQFTGFSADRQMPGGHVPRVGPTTQSVGGPATIGP